MLRVMVTGANGFVGRKLCRALEEHGYDVRKAVRCSPAVDEVAVGDIGPFTDWSKALEGTDTVIHLAARVHILQEVSKNPLEAFRSVNVLGSEHLARMAVQSGVRRFIYISSISIHGNSTDERPYEEEDYARPHSPYAVSKWEGELALRRIADESDLELVIVRPPLVYGPGVGGNFLRLMRWVDKGWPLPLGRVRNLRSFIGIENLVDLLVRCVEHPRAAGEIFLAADSEDLSTPDLIRRVAHYLERPAHILPFPVGMLRAISSVAGMNDVVDRLCNSLQVSTTKASNLLGWLPTVSFDEGLADTVAWYTDVQRGRKR